MNQTLKTIIWVVVGFIAAKMSNEILYDVFNKQGGGLNITNAIIPALLSSIVFAFFIYKSGIFSKERSNLNLHFFAKSKFKDIFLIAVICFLIVIVVKAYLSSQSTSIQIAPIYAPSPPTIEENVERTKTNQDCKFFWNDETVDFEIANDAIKNDSNYEKTYVIKTGKEIEVHSLELLLIDADKKNNYELAKSIANAMSENLITIYYKKHLTKDFIKIEVNGKNLMQRCIN